MVNKRSWDISPAGGLVSVSTRKCRTAYAQGMWTCGYGRPSPSFRRTSLSCTPGGLGQLAPQGVITPQGQAAPTGALVRQIENQPGPRGTASGTGSLDLSALKEAMPTAAAKQALWDVPLQSRPAKVGTDAKREPRLSKARRAKARAEKRKAKRLAKAATKQQATAAEQTAGAGDAAPTADLVKGVSTKVRAPAPVGAGVANQTSQSGGISGPKQGQRSRYRGKSSGKQRAERNARTSGAANGNTKPPKRARPNDTLSPKDGGKRAKTGATPDRTAKGGPQGKVSYADAIGSCDLAVAVITEPFHELKEEHAVLVQDALERHWMRPSSPRRHRRRSRIVLLLSRQGLPGRGVLKLRCEDDFSLGWLRSTIEGLHSPIAGTRLVVRRQSEVPRRVRAGMFLQFTDKSVDDLRVRLRRQNTWYNIDSWSLYRAEKQENKDGDKVSDSSPTGEQEKPCPEDKTGPESAPKQTTVTLMESATGGLGPGIALSIAGVRTDGLAAQQPPSAAPNQAILEVAKALAEETKKMDWFDVEGRTKRKIC
ncbi:hypothetical protein NE865_12702 [Phthorimaea operculella]|nr:hypothetical protein NE865_12702 [Phthorimaea operculella]